MGAAQSAPHRSRISKNAKGETMKKNFNVKAYLQEIREKRQHVERLKERRAALHMDVPFGGIDYSADRIVTTPKNKMEEAMMKLSARLERIDRTIARLSVEIDDRIESIEQLEDKTQRDILYLRYVDNLSFEQICVDLKRTYKYICNVHGEALGKVKVNLHNME